MNDSKPWWQSRAILGSALAVVALALNMFGFEFGAEDQASLIDTVVNAGGVVGAIMGIYGRVVATKTVTL